MTAPVQDDSVHRCRTTHRLYVEPARRLQFVSCKCGWRSELVRRRDVDDTGRAHLLAQMGGKRS